MSRVAENRPDTPYTLANWLRIWQTYTACMFTVFNNPSYEALRPLRERSSEEGAATQQMITWAFSSL